MYEGRRYGEPVDEPGDPTWSGSIGTRSSERDLHQGRGRQISIDQRGKPAQQHMATRLEPAMFDLAVCAEMVFLDLPFEQRVRRIAESGFQVEIWNWTRHDIDVLVHTGARFSSMVGHTSGSLLDEDGANALLHSAKESLAVAERLGCPRLLLFGTELGPDGVPLRTVHEVTGAMWLNAYRTLCRLAELGERAGVTFCLENLNTTIDHPGAPFARANDTLALVEAVGRPGLRMMLDLYHAQIGEGNLIELLKRANKLIGEVQVADVPGRREPGTGEINYSAIAKALDEMGYCGTVGLEAYASGDDKIALERFSSTFGAGALAQQRPSDDQERGHKPG
jgi:hydroxypyruvate isomerase